MRPFAFAGLAVALAACAPARIVAPLAFEPRAAAPVSPAEEALRASPPALAPASAPRPVEPRAFTLANGARVIVVERPGRGTIAARLAFGADSVELSDAGALRASLVGRVFLVNDDDDATSAGCDALGCSIATRVTSDELGAAFERIEARLRGARERTPAQATRLATGLRYRRGENPAFAIQANVQAALFAGTVYDAPTAADPTLDALAAMRDEILRPARAVLVVVGDTTLEDVKREAESRFAAWTARDSDITPSRAPAPLPPMLPVSRSMPSIRAVPMRITQAHAVIAARGPAAADRDYFAFVLASELLGGTRGAIVPAQVRDEMAAGAAVASSVFTTRDASTFELGGSFDLEKTVDALVAQLDALRALRRGPVDAARFERARRSLAGRWRSAQDGNAGLATAIAWRARLGLDPMVVDDVARLEAVTADDVTRVARTWLGDDRLRVVVVGDTGWLGPELPRLGLGDGALRNVYGRAP